MQQENCACLIFYKGDKTYIGRKMTYSTNGASKTGFLSAGEWNQIYIIHRVQKQILSGSKVLRFNGTTKLNSRSLETSIRKCKG